MYYRSCDSSQQLCKGLDLIPSASWGCPRGQTGPQISSESERPGSRMGFWALPFKACHPGWLAANVNCLLFLLDFPGSLDARAAGLPGVPRPALSPAPRTLSEFFTGESQLLPPPFTGWLAAVRDGRGGMEEPSRFWRFCREGKSFFFSLPILGSLVGAKLIKLEILSNSNELEIPWWFSG